MNPPSKSRSPHGEGRRPELVDVTRDGVTRKESRYVGSTTTPAATKASTNLRSATGGLVRGNTKPDLPAPVAGLLTSSEFFPQQLVELPADTPPDDELMKPVVNKPWRNKPDGGLWTATQTGPATSTWTEWRNSEGYVQHGDIKPWAMRLPDGVYVLRINSADDLRTLIEHFGAGDSSLGAPTIDYEKLAATGVHGIWLTDAGQAATRFADDDGPDLYGWDMECTLWLTLPDGTTFTPAG